MIQETSGLLINISSNNVRQNNRVDEKEPVAERRREPQEESGENSVRDSVTLSAQAMALAKTVNPATEGPEVSESGSGQSTLAQSAAAPAAGPRYLDIRV